MALMKRFKSSDNFPVNSEYKLLPIRFTELDNERVVITNMVGEHIVVSQDSLNSLITRSKPLDDSLLAELYSKHIIYDGVSQLPLKLSGLKYRTKIARLKNFTALHMVVTTLRCDYTCHYCQVSRQNLSSDNSQFDMTVETADKVLNLIFKSPAKALKIEFQGGESLLNFDVIKHIVLNAEIRAETEGRNMQYVIATNLSPLNDEILEFCKLYRIYISTSLDGPFKLHNRNRPRPGNNGHQLTVAAIDKVKSHIGIDHISALMTTSGRSLDFSKEIIDEYIKNGLHAIFLRPLSPYGFAVTKGHINRYDTEKWLDFFKESLSYIIEVNKQGYPLIEQYSSLILTKILTARDLGYVDLQSPAGAMISGIIYNYDGDVYASDEARMQAEIGHTEFRLGNVNENTYEEIIGNEFMLDSIEKSFAISSPQCTDCAFLPYCGSDPVYHLATQNDVVGNKQLSGFCKKNIGIFKLLITLLEDSDLHTKRILKSWARY
ncbi:His-Xaa-Ser system radical SAM maturase HxsB [Shewanella saliphila]|uniref:His-Xaa-Ser system radical SAM maturase HxsB n=1 Tax=Shewanella saliphila TaxID=2282698 RepID=A0ABQ2Q0K7_9GAMM|nr:His-Xaa-Ser system radical SAM maturase HxsB [Shewanella saliphila]MCL1100407.1 His-Xaa-Ser system radical SAM maturase HxsB [Shewanella saliphila]GGP37208.1 His-Xaa-Ser system radical SAM maturase HxsB [Shewanella saliphila]